MDCANIPKTYILVLTSTLAITCAVGLLFYQKRKRSQPPAKWEKVGEVTELYIYPLKSGRRVPLMEAECTKYGLKQTAKDERVYQMRDRELVVYNAKTYEFQTARTCPKMVLIEASVHDEEHFAIDAPGMRTLYVKRPKAEETAEVYVKCWYNERIHALDCGDEAATWFSRYILNEDSGVRLGYHAGTFQRDICTAHKKFLKFYKNFTNDSAGLFSDLASCLIINENSVNDLNERIGTPTVTPYNFRPTILVNCPAYLEDKWNWIKIGDVVLQVIKPCTRCIFTTIDPETGIKNENGEPLKTLRTYHPVENPELRKLENYAPTMGVNVGVRKTGLIKRGDAVYAGKG